MVSDILSFAYFFGFCTCELSPLEASHVVRFFAHVFLHSDFLPSPFFFKEAHLFLLSLFPSVLCSVFHILFAYVLVAIYTHFALGVLVPPLFS